MLNQQLAYPAATIEPFTDVTRDEGEPRLGLLRELFATASEEATEECGELYSALFCEATRPKICLCCVGSVRCTPQGVRDVVGDEAASAVRRVAIKGTNSVAVFSPAITLRTRETSFLAVELSGASLRISRVGEHDVCILGLGAIDVEVEFDRSKAGTLSRLFEPPLTTSLENSLLPKKPEDVPGDIMSDVADFWTRIIRAHVVVAVCAPNNAAWPLAFDNMRVYTSPDAKKDTQLELYATLHAASVTCACALHGLPPPAAEQDSEVELCLRMCGRRRAVRADHKPFLRHSCIHMWLSPPQRLGATHLPSLPFRNRSEQTTCRPGSRCID